MNKLHYTYMLVGFCHKLVEN